MSVDAPVRMSHSRMAGYGRCGWQYKLTRIDGIAERPSVALAGGSAFHQWTEDHDWWKLTDLEGAFDFRSYFEMELSDLEQSSGVGRDEFKTSGRRTKDRPNGEDIEYWASTLGPEMTKLYEEFAWPDGWEIATGLPPDQDGRTTGIEYHVELLDPLWQGFYDRIFTDRNGNLIVVDLKTWQQKRTSAQLQEYMTAGQLVGMRTVEGAYYNARKGTLDGPHPCKWTTESFREYVQLTQMGIEQEYFPPVVADHCGWCGVRESCVFAP